MKFRSVGVLVVLMAACLSLGFAGTGGFDIPQPPIPKPFPVPDQTCVWSWNGVTWTRVLSECNCPEGTDSFPPNWDGDNMFDYSEEPCWSDVMLLSQSPANRYMIQPPAGGPVFEVVPQQMPSVRE